MPKRFVTIFVMVFTTVVMYKASEFIFAMASPSRETLYLGIFVGVGLYLIPTSLYYHNIEEKIDKIPYKNIFKDLVIWFVFTLLIIGGLAWSMRAVYYNDPLLHGQWCTEVTKYYDNTSTIYNISCPTGETKAVINSWYITTSVYMKTTHITTVDETLYFIVPTTS